MFLCQIIGFNNQQPHLAHKDIELNKINDEQLYRIVKLYCQLDALRAKKFVHPETLETSIKTSGGISIVQQNFPEWKTMLSKLSEELSSKSPTIEFIQGLQRVEMVPLILYLIVTGGAMITSSSFLWQAQTVVAIVAFTYLAVVRIASYFLITKPVTQIVSRLNDSIYSMDDKLYNTINELIDTVNSQLLTYEKSPNEYKHYLDHLDYHGLYYRGRRTVLGPRRIQSIPFPLHSILSSYSGVIRIIMARMDEKLISGLEDIPQDIEIKLITMTTIARHTSFNYAISALYKAHENLQVSLMPPDPEIKGVQILMEDSAWRFDLDATWNETRYIKVKGSSQYKQIENTFNRLWKTAKPTKIRIKENQSSGK